MNLGISKKLIFTCLFIINFTEPSKSTEFQRLNEVEKYRTTNLGWSKILYKETPSNSSKALFNKHFNEISSDKKKFTKKEKQLLADTRENKQELVIKSNQQSEIDDVIYADGNVSVSYRGKLLKADNLIYDKLNKEIKAEGNITFILGNQIFKVSKLEYSFITEKGYLLDVKGLLNTNTLMDDLSSNFISSDLKK